MLTALDNLIDERNESKQAEVLRRFAKLYYAGVPQEELLERTVEQMYGALMSCWHMMQVRKPGEVKVNVLNPDYENHGWQSLHTVIEVICDDVPFLLDSIRMKLNTHDMSQYLIHYCVVHAERTKTHKLSASKHQNWQSPSDTSRPEALIYIEVDHHSNQALLDTIRDELLSVMDEVKYCVEDFPAIVDKAKEAIKSLQQNRKANDSERQEAQAFMEWLLDNHFTFLAYDEFEITERKNETLVVRDEEQDLGIFRYSRASRNKLRLSDLNQDIQSFITSEQLVSFMKSGTRSSIHRPAYPDYVVIKRFNSEGNVTGGVRFMGLYTSMVYIESPDNIPIIRNKLKAIRELSAYATNSHNAKELNRILEVYPRDELFQSTAEELQKTAISILNIQERRKTRVFLRKDEYSKFLSCLAYVPRDIYNTELREKIQNVMCDEFEPLDVEFNTYFSESVLARTHFMLRLNPEKPVEFDEALMARKITQVVTSWQDELHDALVEQVGEEQGNHQFHSYRTAFPAGYRENFTALTAVSDIQHMDIAEQDTLAMSFYRELEEDDNQLRFKLFNRDALLPLSDVIPVLENLGLRVLGEHPYEIIRSDGMKVWIHDFQLNYCLSDSINISEVKELFQNSFRAIWEGRAENDNFNKLVLGAQLGWRDIAILRSYARYMKQIRFGISESYIAETLCRYIDISASLVNFFKQKFGLYDITDEARKEQLATAEEQLLDALEGVEQLNEDRTIRRYIELINATLRTNFFQPDEEGKDKDYVSFKLNPSAISNIPLPCPMFEIFVYSPRVEGVHLRGGKVARGGLRWSDRSEDFRTEVLGLVKAQQVKNAVIVPVGAKGGFVARKLPKEGGRDAFIAEGIACYKTFISALLDVTDNLVEGQVVPPQSVIRHDQDDPYLVVAADKGTATFSDIANEIAVNRGFWMGDGFASGGSIGYDHKKMGITARGAWVSVQRHFREQGINVQETDFSVVGIGDMSGDVFGNGMLLSEHICLTAAFNHLHIFIDPTPDSTRSFVERKRLFELPRSSWEDYDKKLISKGGGIFSRSAKSIAISKQMKQVFDITEDRLAPNDLISALLKAPVDLIWNGGIGTYIKGSTEQHGDVGDKANDTLRVDGKDIRAKVIGEGGNLGVTQLGRVEFALNGGASYTDFIDNAAGVDCSDHEVNIKIMLNDVMDSGDLTRKQRNKIFMDMTDQVSDLVLSHNYSQTQAIALSYRDCRTRMDEYIRLIRDFERAGKLNRELEFLPNDEILAERRNTNTGLTQPELSVLISYTKADLKEKLNHPDMYTNEYISNILLKAFPQELHKKFSEPMYRHRLRSEIIATQLANDMVNYMGTTFVNRLRDSTGADINDIARAFLTARDIFALPEYWSQISSLDYQVGTKVQEDMMSDMMRLVRRASRWFLRNRRLHVDIQQEVERFKTPVQTIMANMGDMLKGSSYQRWETLYQQRIDAGVPKELASITAGAANLYASLGIIEAAHQTGCELMDVAHTYFEIGERLSLNWFMQQINDLPSNTHWDALARETLRDDMDWQQRAITEGVVSSLATAESCDAIIEQWEADQAMLVKRWQEMLTELNNVDHVGFSMVSVALRELLDLAQASRHARSDAS